MYLGAVALTTWALLDVAQTPPESFRSLSKGTWALLVVVPFVGPAAWFVPRHRIDARPLARGRSVRTTTRSSCARSVSRATAPSSDDSRPQRFGRPPYECRPLNQMFTPK